MITNIGNKRGRGNWLLDATGQTTTLVDGDEVHFKRSPKSDKGLDMSFLRAGQVLKIARINDDHELMTLTLIIGEDEAYPGLRLHLAASSVACGIELATGLRRKEIYQDPDKVTYRFDQYKD